MRRALAGMLVAATVSGCAPILGSTRDPVYQGNGPGPLLLPPLNVYQDSTGPLSYRSTVGARAAPDVTGLACQSAFMFPVGLVWAAAKSGNFAHAPGFLSVAMGDGGYARAVAAAQAVRPQARLVNVRADLRTRIILGVWREQCVRITASAVP